MMLRFIGGGVTVVGGAVLVASPDGDAAGLSEGHGVALAAGDAVASAGGASVGREPTGVAGVSVGVAVEEVPVDVAVSVGVAAAGVSVDVPAGGVSVGVAPAGGAPAVEVGVDVAPAGGASVAEVGVGVAPAGGASVAGLGAGVASTGGASVAGVDVGVALVDVTSVAGDGDAAGAATLTKTLLMMFVAAAKSLAIVGVAVDRTEETGVAISGGKAERISCTRVPRSLLTLPTLWRRSVASRFTWNWSSGALLYWIAPTLVEAAKRRVGMITLACMIRSSSYDQRKNCKVSEDEA